MIGLVIVATGAFIIHPDSAVGAVLTVFAFTETSDAGGAKVRLNLMLFIFITIIPLIFYVGCAAKLMWQLRGTAFRFVYILMVVFDNIAAPRPDVKRRGQY